MTRIFRPNDYSYKMVRDEDFCSAARFTPFFGVIRRRTSPLACSALIASLCASACQVTDQVVAMRATQNSGGGASAGGSSAVPDREQPPGELAGGAGGGISPGIEEALVFHLPFDGNLNDIAGGRVGTQVSEDGSVLSYAEGVAGQSLDLQETTAHVALSNEAAFAPEDFTLSFWAQSKLPHPEGSPQTLLGFGRNCRDSYGCGLYPDATIKCSLVDGRGWCEDAVTLDADWKEGQFVHVAFVVEQNAEPAWVSLSLYLDGELVGSDERSDYFPISEPERPFAVGANYQLETSVGIVPYYSKAQIDDLRLYNRALSAPDVRLLFEQRAH